MPADRLRTAGRHAWTTRAVRAGLASAAAVADTSRAVTAVATLADALRGAWTASATETGTSHGVVVSGRLLRGSRVVETARWLAEPLGRTGRPAADRATVMGLARWSEGATRSSWLYRWLTAEPEPEVIVIDLRETISVGPVIILLDRLIRWLVPASHRSTVVGVAKSVHQSVRAAPVQVTSLVLAVAVLTNLGLTLATGEPTQAGVVARIVLLGLAAIGTRITMTWDELVETRPVRLLIAALEPPEPPDDGT